jgi:hypothetical protein
MKNTGDTKVLDNFIGLVDLQTMTKKNEKRTVTLLKDIDAIIHSAVNRRYRLPANMTTASVIRGRLPSNTGRTGRYIYKNGITYGYKSIPLSRFLTSESIGNIEPIAEKTKPGLVHRVQIRRKGGEKISYGKLGFGGFIPREGKIDGKKVRNKNFPKWGITMWERNSRSAYEIHPLRGPSISQMVATTMKEDASLKGRIEKLMLDRLISYK